MIELGKQQYLPSSTSSRRELIYLADDLGKTVSSSRMIIHVWNMVQSRARAQLQGEYLLSNRPTNPQYYDLEVLELVLFRSMI